MKKTENYGLSLYEKEDNMSITAEENSLNANMKIIDSTLKEKATIQDMTNYIEEHKEELKGDTGLQGEPGKDGVNGKNGVDGKAGADGKDGKTPVKGTDYWTETDKEEIKDELASELITQSSGKSTTLVMSQKAVTDLVAEALSGGENEYKTVDSVEEMIDETKSYVLSSTGTVWKYGEIEVETETETTEQIVGTTDNPFEKGRLSNGSANNLAGYITTPYIDLTKFSGTFELHLEGIPFLHTDSSNIRFSTYDTSKTHITTQLTNSSAINTYTNNITLIANNENETFALLCTKPVTTGDGTEIGYMRFSGEGTEADANVYVKYTKKITTTGEGWYDTKISVADVTEFNITNSSVEGFIASTDYQKDLTKTVVTTYSKSSYYRKDLPLPIRLKWENDLSVVETTVAINDKSGILNTGMKTYYVEGNELAIYNLIPNKTYYYIVSGLCADGRVKTLKSGNFTTKGTTRMLNIEGTQNVRDIGGYSIGTKKVKYGLIYRGAALDEDEANSRFATSEGKRELVKRVGIRTDIDLRAGATKTALGESVELFHLNASYENYANAITNETQRGNFKNILDYIVTRITANKPIYIHCSGGCDRTGTIIFLLLGLLGASEIDLAKEYELSSFSTIGTGRTIDGSYNYSGMVSAIKTYSGDTITDKFYDFAVNGCGVSEDTITAFRNLMLE